MVPGSRLCRAPCCNSTPADFVENELAGALPGAPTKSSGPPLTSLVPFCASTPGLAPASPPPAPPVTTPAPAPTEDLFRQFMQAYMEDRRNSAPAPASAPLAEPREDVSDRPLKTRNPDLYYGNSCMECYHFCQQFEDHFETTRAKGHKLVPFVAFFLKDRILHR